MKYRTVVMAALVTGASVFFVQTTPAATVVVPAAVQDGSPNDHNDAAPDIYDAINVISNLNGSGTPHTDNDDVAGLLQTDVTSSGGLQKDDIWTELNGTITLIGLTAGNINTLGVYTDLGVGASLNPLITATGFGYRGSGTSADPFTDWQETSLGQGSQFGFYLESASGTRKDRFFSEAILNRLDTNMDGTPDTPETQTGSGGNTFYDHMLVYDLSSFAGTQIYLQGKAGPVTLSSQPWLIVWEDLPIEAGNCDDDYDDMMYILDKVSPSSTVPEPTALLVWSALAGSGCGLASLRRRKGWSDKDRQAIQKILQG